MHKLSKYLLTGLKAILIYVAIQAVSVNLFALLPTLDLAGEWGIRNLTSALFPYNFSAFALLAFAGILTVRTPNTAGPRDLVFSLVCATLWLLGYGYYTNNSCSILYCRKISMIFTVLVWLGAVCFLLSLLQWMKRFYHALRARELSLPAFLAKHCFLSAWGLAFLCWLPYIILRYPAGIEYDAYYQIEEFLGILPMTAHWPPFSSALMGAWVWLGNALFHSYNIGVFLFVLFQSLVCSAIFAYTVLAMKRLGIRPIWRVICALIYALATIFPNYLTAVIKDALYASMVVLFTALLAECLFLPRKKLRIAGLAVSGLLMCMLRNNGVYVLLICIIALGAYVLVKRNKLYLPLLLAMILSCGLNVCYSHALTALGISAGSIAEALSVPFQQTARYVSTYPEDVTEEEAEIIRGVLDYDSLPQLYDPNLSDPVKATYHGDNQALTAYLGVWVKQFFRHPSVYFAATLNNSCGYYYPFAQNQIFYSTTRSEDVLQFDECQALAGAKKGLSDYVALFETIPVLRVTSSAGFQTWIVLFLLLTVLFRREKKPLLLLLPALIGIAVCIASPTYTVNGVRYALPVIYYTPMLAGICLFRDPSAASGA